MVETESKYRAVQGKNPSKRELVTWDEGQWICFLRFCEIFVSTSEKKTTDGSGVKFKVTEAKWREVEGFLDMPDHPFQEFLYRIDKFTYDPSANATKFYWKFLSMVKFVLGYLKSNPSIVTEKMREIIEPNPRFNWCLTQTKVVETIVGPMVVPDREERVGNHPTNMDIASYEKNLADAVTKTTNLLVRLVESVKPEELEKMPVKDRLMAIGRMSYVFTVGKSFKVNKGVFKQINIHAADRDTLEAALLDFNKEE